MADKEAQPGMKDYLQSVARFDYWKLTTACQLVTGGAPEFMGLDHPRPKQYAYVYEAAISCAGQSLMVVDDSVSPERYRVSPSVFVSWLSDVGIEPNPEFTEHWGPVESKGSWDSAQDIQEIRELFTLETGHPLPRKIAARLRNFSARSEAKIACRALASFLWSLEPETTTRAMSSRKELKVFGCRGENFGARNVSAWIADLNPNPSPGRPAASKSREKP